MARPCHGPLRALLRNCGRRGRRTVQRQWRPGAAKPHCYEVIGTSAGVRQLRTPPGRPVHFDGDGSQPGGATTCRWSRRSPASPRRRAGPPASTTRPPATGHSRAPVDVGRPGGGRRSQRLVTGDRQRDLLSPNLRPGDRPLPRSQGSARASTPAVLEGRPELAAARGVVAPGGLAQLHARTVAQQVLAPDDEHHLGVLIAVVDHLHVAAGAVGAEHAQHGVASTRRRRSQDAPITSS